MKSLYNFLIDLIKYSVPGVSKKDFRFRYFYMLVFCSFSVLLNILIDPRLGFIQELKFGASTIATIALTLRVTVFVTLYHLTRVALFDYFESSQFYDKALETPLSASIALVAQAIHGLAIVYLIHLAFVN